jgi:hypothetical protein
LRVRSDELYENAAILVRHARDQSKLVTADVKDHSVVGNEVHAVEHGANVGWTIPCRLRHQGIPCAQRNLGLGMPLPENLQRPARYDLHEPVIARSQNGNKKNVPISGRPSPNGDAGTLTPE